MCDTLVDPSDPRTQYQLHQDHLVALGSSLDMILPKLTSNASGNQPMVVELYQVATQIYFSRVSQRPWEPVADFDSLVDAVFAGPGQSCVSCVHFFPLLILACEARKDDHRTIILNLIDRTARDSRMRSVQGVEHAIQTIWIQQDLNADTALVMGYVKILGAAVCSSSYIPSFA